MSDHPKPADQPATLLDAEQHKRIAAQLFNLTWTLMEKADRTGEDDSVMVHAAHASAWHWRQVGNHVNFARSEWQCSRVYATLWRPAESRRHAHRCLDFCQQHELKGFDMAFAYEALARAAAISGDGSAYDRYHKRATEAGEAIEASEDRDYFFHELNGIPDWVMQRRGDSEAST